MGGGGRTWSSISPGVEVPRVIYIVTYGMVQLRLAAVHTSWLDEGQHDGTVSYSSSPP